MRNSKSRSNARFGLGLRPAFYRELWAPADSPEAGVLDRVDFFEIISENFVGEAAAAPALRMLDWVAAHKPVVLHGVALNILGPDPLDTRLLDGIAALAERVDAAHVTDHLCWSGAHGLCHHDLLPTPYRDDLVAYAANRARTVANHIGRPFGLENLSSYVTFSESTLSEWAFYAAVAREADVGLLLDVNNIAVSAANHGFESADYLDGLAPADYARVLEIHVAGHEPKDPEPGVIVDTHNRPVEVAVWRLLAEAQARIVAAKGTPAPVLLEWDDAIPPLAVAVAELDKARVGQP
jgi:uncharacterized protein